VIALAFARAPHVDPKPGAIIATEGKTVGLWQRWLQHPERLWLHKLFFQIHYAAGLGISLYVLVVSISGSIIVYRNELAPARAVEWLVKLHENLLFGETGRLVNGIGSLFLTLVCLTGAVIWWPGIMHWRRSLTVKWNTRLPRFTWDLHSALGFWTLPFVLMWGVSGIYFSFPDFFNSVLAFFDPVTGSTIEACFGSPKLILADLGGSRKPSGVPWDLCLSFFRFPACSCVATGWYTRKAQTRIVKRISPISFVRIPFSPSHERRLVEPRRFFAKTAIHTAPGSARGWDTGPMASVDSVIAELKELTPDQLDRVAQVVHELAAERSHRRLEPQGYARVPESVVAEAVRNGWPAELLTEVIGQVDEDFGRPPQLPFEPRPSL